jgi:hypothetical protein
MQIDLEPHEYSSSSELKPMIRWWLLPLAITMLSLMALHPSAQERDSKVYTLYRNSVLPDMRIHIATFDATEGAEYNRTNCELGRQLFQQQPGVSVQYWCEPGRFQE